VDLEAVGQRLEGDDAVLVGDLRRRDAGPFRVHRVDRAEIDAGKVVGERDGQERPVKLFADDGRRLLVDGADALVLDLFHAVEEAHADLQGPVLLHRSGVDLVPGLGELERLLVKHHGKLHGHAALQAYLDGDLPVVFGVAYGQREIRLRGREAEDDIVYDDKGRQADQEERDPGLSGLSFLPFYMPVLCYFKYDGFCHRSLLALEVSVTGLT